MWTTTATLTLALVLVCNAHVHLKGKKISARSSRIINVSDTAIQQRELYQLPPR
eukprot:m.660163 g.660163  ORF g.660163 m.660163 type:complete len:54 (+) comp22728_c0_seq30:200-361(+)